jgi:hypothetical protein
MPSHYDKPLPTRKPPVPSRAIRGDAPTRGMNPAEIEAAFKAGEITQEEAMAMMENFQRMRKANTRAKGGMIKPKKKKMMGGGMASKRNGNMDYRKGGMVYSTKVKKG